MTRQQIEKFTVDYALANGGIMEGEIIDFAVEVYNIAITDASRALGLGTHQMTLDQAFSKIEPLRIKR